MRASSRILLIICTIFLAIWVYKSTSNTRLSSIDVTTNPYPPGCDSQAAHPIDTLIQKASNAWPDLISKECHSLDLCLAQYVKRRGRPPPPGFDDWYRFAASSGAVIIEDFFDQIYHDLEPFWGIKPRDVRAAVVDWVAIIRIRNGKIDSIPNAAVRTTIWVEMLSEVVHLLPDMDIPVNWIDEARVLAPHHVVSTALAAAGTQKEMMMQQPWKVYVSDLSAMKLTANSIATQSLVAWNTDKDDMQRAIRDTCPPHSALASRPLPWNSKAPYTHPASQSTFVDDTLLAKDICKQPMLTSQHGNLIEASTVEFTTSLIPMFTGSKLPVYNDIIIPEPSYYSDKEMFSGKTFWGDYSTYYKWSDKVHGLVWRGGATGGAAHDDNWQQFHRHRLVSRLNATETDDSLTGQRPRSQSFLSWLTSVADVAFTRLFCDSQRKTNECPHMSSHYHLSSPIKMADQYQWKYLPDTDGKSVSERFRAFLLSNSAPIKATIFDDWQDHRLLTWRHYIPMQLNYEDLYEIMAYFLGFDKTCAHDTAGEQIAEEGRLWAEKVLRKDDMVIYLYRALLEYARIAHDNRDRLAFVGQLSR